jgi:pimeloyl-ACP methyl ester carboxylesterase
VTEYVQVTTGAGTFDAIAAGPEDGPGVLLLHGFPEAAIAWEHQVGALGAAGYRAVAPDQRGYSPGVRPDAVEAYAMDELAGDVAAIADALGWPAFHLVGHDWGGAVAWIVADRVPDRVRTLTVVSTPHPRALGLALREDEDQQQRSGYMQLFRQARQPERMLLGEDAKGLRGIFERSVPRSRVDEYVSRLSEEGALTAALHWYRAMRLGNTAAEEITVPTMYVWSTEDVAFGSIAAFATGAFVTGAYRFEMLEDVSHWIPEQAPEALSGLLLDHLEPHRVVAG